MNVFMNFYAFFASQHGVTIPPLNFRYEPQHCMFFSQLLRVREVWNKLFKTAIELTSQDCITRHELPAGRTVCLRETPGANSSGITRQLTDVSCMLLRMI